MYIKKIREKKIDLAVLPKKNKNKKPMNYTYWTNKKVM